MHFLYTRTRTRTCTQKKKLSLTQKVEALKEYENEFCMLKEAL